MKLKTTFDSENGLLSLKQAGAVVSFFKELRDPIGMEERAAASPCLSWFGHLGMCFGHIQLRAEDTPRRTRNPLEGICLPPLPGRTWWSVRGAGGGSWREDGLGLLKS